MAVPPERAVLLSGDVGTQSQLLAPCMIKLIQVIKGSVNTRVIRQKVNNHEGKQAINCQARPMLSIKRHVNQTG